MPSSALFNSDKIMGNELKKCNYCNKMLTLLHFGTHTIKGVEVVYSRCKECRPKSRALDKNISKSDKRKVSRKRHETSKQGKAGKKRFRKSEKGLVYTKRQDRRHTKVRAERSKVDPAFRLYQTLRVVAAGLLSGSREASPTFVQNTSFVNEAEFQTHMKQSALALEFSMDDYGSKWVIEHIIPQEAFDFSNPEDVKRCWSAPNVRALNPKENDEKGVLIIDELCSKVGVARFPLSWNGAIPIETEKQFLYTKWNAPWISPV